MKKDVFKKPAFWTAVSAFFVLILQAIGLRVENEAINQLLIAACSFLVIGGVISSTDFSKIKDELEKKNVNKTDEDEDTDDNK